ncbi:UvrD-helicase domain-containing protein [Clostridium tertium]|uniref:UvrD-helicase domain-containing protein n=1 Tax=Clostridium tertium TaxID=1559 RepID=UPI00232F5F34|nr:UvrD-helicase domain-containing protein [Clostridium tertium]MDB1934000.1 UvrD-helicase domain-containing protein [Clostridium tertium]MDB1937125.1 UvrD-helicase domain-containing protein [Clostridium tertium]
MIKIVDNIEIIEDDIRYAEEILFGKTNIFDKDRIPIIEDFNNSFDVNACPGSGKTTVLLAKLIILSRKMPLNNGQGICVLTHTNVAIDEIKSKLGDKSDILFKYPNYFGTIQNFVDKYLAIPYFKKQKNENIKTIDNDIYYDHIRKLSKLIYPQIRNSIQYSVQKGWGNYTNESYEKNFITFIDSKQFDIDTKEIKGNNNTVLTNRKFYEELKDVMINKTLDKGILRYKDAYFLAGLYLKEFPELQNYFSNRFRYVFIDEMQDIDEIQIKILDKIFNDQVIIQRFGDINQVINNFNSNCNIWRFNEDIRAINSSKRYGEGIVKFLEPLRVKKIGSMKGNDKINTLNPHIIIFDNSTIHNVVPKYIDILEGYNIKEDENKKIKIIGKIGTPVSEQYKSIASYIKGYKTKGNKHVSLNKKIIKRLNEISSPKEFYEYLMSVILLSVDNNKKKVSKDELIKLLEDKYMSEFITYRSNIVDWIKNFSVDTSIVLEDILIKTKGLFDVIKELNYSGDILKNKITIRTGEEAVTLEENEVNEEIIKIDNINTISGTKGETHKATLYLESKLIFNSGKDISDISRILDYMFNKKEKVDEEDREALMNAYVAMSRAEKLTCIAIQYETIKGRMKEFQEYGYKLVGCNDDMNELISKELQVL